MPDSPLLNITLTTGVVWLLNQYVGIKRECRLERSSPSISVLKCHKHYTISSVISLILAQAGKVFEKQSGDFMKDVISTGEPIITIVL